MKKLAFIFVIIFLATAGETSAQLFKTQLEVTVLDELGNPVEEATIKLFRNQEDYKAEKNQVGETLITDERGRAKYPDLESMTYFILVEKGDLNNWNGAVQTDKLKEKRVNKIRVIID